MAESLEKQQMPPPRYAPSSMPLGARSAAVPIGSNYSAGGATGKFGRTASISKGHSVDQYY